MVNSRKYAIKNGIDLLRFVETYEFDYMDFGCSTGGSLELGKKRFGGCRGIGIDINKEKIKECWDAGYEAIVFDINQIPDKKMVRFTLLSHFLEHVPNLSMVRSFIKKACNISKEFVYIQQPFFDADGYLARNGLKLYWSDWRGHPNHMTSLDLWLILRDFQIEGMDIKFSVYGDRKISNSSDTRVQNLVSRGDLHHFDPTLHPPKDESIVFTEPVYSELRCLITMPGVTHKHILEKFNFDKSCRLIPEVQ